MANATKDFYDDYKNYFGGGGGSVTPTPEMEEAIQNLQQAYADLQSQVDQLPTTDNDTIFDPTPLNEAIAALQQEIQDNGTLDLSNITALQNAINALQSQVDQLPTEDNDTIFDPTPLNESISVLQTSLQQFREQAEIAQAQQAQALAQNTQIDEQQQQSITDLTQRVTTLENAPAPTHPVFVASYQQTTAQEIAEFLDENPAAPLLIRQSDGSLLTAIYAHKQSDSKVNVRCIGTLQGEYYVFDNTVNGSSWTATQYPFHDGVGGSSTFSGSWNDLTDKPALFSGSYNDLADKPTLFSGSYNDLTDKPTLFSGSYNDLTDKPTIPDAQVNADWNETDSTSKAFIENKPALPDFSLVPQVKLVDATLDEISIPAGGRVNKQPEFSSIPDSYQVYAYRQISIERATSLVGNNTDPKYDTFMHVSIQSFATAGGGTKANISMVNSGTTDALIKLKTLALVMKIGL